MSLDVLMAGWMSHGDSIDPESMLLTATLNTAPQTGPWAIKREEVRSFLHVFVCDNEAHKQSTGKGEGLTFSKCSQLPGGLRKCLRLSCEQS